MNKHNFLREADRLFHANDYDEEYMEALKRCSQQMFSYTEVSSETYEDLHEFAKHLLSEEIGYAPDRVQSRGVKASLLLLLDEYVLSPGDEGYNDETDKEELYMTRRTL